MIFWMDIVVLIGKTISDSFLILFICFNISVLWYSVGTADVGFPIRLEGLVYAHSQFASYEPELFPGLIYRLVNPRVVFLIFVSGKVVITGAKKESDLSSALTKLYPVLVEFKKSHVAPLPSLPAALPDAAGGDPSGVAPGTQTAQI